MDLIIFLMQAVLFLEWLEGNESPGVIALKENNLN